jgi:biopolymer transport protein ExbD
VSARASDAPDDDIVAEINVTPLTDIFLVLLIIFMVTSTALIQQGTPVELPRSRAGVSTPSGVTLTLAKDRTVEVNGTRVTIDELKDALTKALAETSESSVILQGDRQIVLEDAVHVMAVAKAAGASKIAIATDPREAAGP